MGNILSTKDFVQQVLPFLLDKQNKEIGLQNLTEDSAKKIAELLSAYDIQEKYKGVRKFATKANIKNSVSDKEHATILINLFENLTTESQQPSVESLKEEKSKIQQHIEELQKQLITLETSIAQIEKENAQNETYRIAHKAIMNGFFG